MPDAVALLTPILVLGVLLLLGYAGCDAVFGLDPVPHNMCVLARVPEDLVVTEINVRFERPGGEITIVPTPNPIPGSTEGGNNVFRVNDGPVKDGTWKVTCRVTVVEDAATATRARAGTFILDGTIEAPCANFQASGTPSAGTFDVLYEGVT